MEQPSHHVTSIHDNFNSNQKVNVSKNRDTSLDPAKNNTPNSSETGLSLPSVVPSLGLFDEGTSSLSDNLIQCSNAISSITKSSSGSRGSSPASKKKSLSDGGVISCKRRSPLVSRKGMPISDGQSTPPTGRVRYYSQDGQVASSVEDCDVEGAATIGVANGSGECADLNSSSFTIDHDDVDSNTPHDQKTKELLYSLQGKIRKTTDLIKEEQSTKEANVEEYLKLSVNADRQQQFRIKAVFEKKNQKSAATIQQLQRKKENYLRKLREIESHGVVLSRQPKEVLKEMSQGIKSVGGNIRDGISGLSGRAALIQKPKEIAHLFKNKFGSADNIKELEDEKDEEKTHHGSATLPPNSGLHPTSSSVALSSNMPPAMSGTVSGSGGSGGAGGGGGGSSGGGKVCSDEGSECSSSMASESIPGSTAAPPVGQFPSPRNRDANVIPCDEMKDEIFTELLQEIRDLKGSNIRLREELELTKQEIGHMRDCLVDRCDRLEEQVNDLTELNQNETENLKTAITDMEEKVQYQSDERIRDLNEVVENCQTRISRMEHQQAQQQQQFLTLEGLENSNARVLIVKLINVLLTILQVFLLVVATVVGIVTPLLQTRTRLISTFALGIFLIFIYTQISEIKEMWHYILHRLTTFS